MNWAFQWVDSMVSQKAVQRDDHWAAWRAAQWDEKRAARWVSQWVVWKDAHWVGTMVFQRAAELVHHLAALRVVRSAVDWACHWAESRAGLRDGQRAAARDAQWVEC